MNNLNRFLEATLLHPTLTGVEVDEFLKEIENAQLVSCLLPPFWIKKAARTLQESNVQLSAAISFPFGYQDTASKVFETKEAIRQGVDELDVVWSQTAFHSGMNWPKIELAQLSKVCHEEGKLLKVIIETDNLSQSQLIDACLICQDAGVDYLKSSSGLLASKVNPSTIDLMRKTLSSSVGIIASASEFSLEEARSLINSGADRIACSNAMDIFEDWQKQRA